jgi:hypothetical protein
VEPEETYIIKQLLVKLASSDNAQQWNYFWETLFSARVTPSRKGVTSSGQNPPLIEDEVSFKNMYISLENKENMAMTPYGTRKQD